uniref:glycoprotein integral membrane protein 1 n=1 Tax=Myxine glutinosa TaxID=7769 RepID=UPI00358F63C7
MAVSLFTFGLLALMASVGPGQAAEATQTSVTTKVTVQMVNSSEQYEVSVVVGTLGGQVYVNAFLVSLNMVMRIKRHALVAVVGESGSVEARPVELRVLALEAPSSLPGIEHEVVVQDEVVTVDGIEVHQQKVPMVRLLLGGQPGELTGHSVAFVPFEQSMLFSAPRDSDVQGTSPNLPGKEVPAGLLQTTSHYPLGQAETTLEEVAEPGKLPETPLRAEAPSSYRVVCQRVELLRQELCRLWRQLWAQALSLLWSAALLLLVGTLGAGALIGTLRVVCPHTPRDRLEPKILSHESLQLDLKPLITEKSSTSC